MGDDVAVPGSDLEDELGAILVDRGGAQRDDDAALLVDQRPAVGAREFDGAIAMKAVVPVVAQGDRGDPVQILVLGVDVVVLAETPGVSAAEGGGQASKDVRPVLGHVIEPVTADGGEEEAGAGEYDRALSQLAHY